MNRVELLRVLAMKGSYGEDHSLAGKAALPNALFDSLSVEMRKSSAITFPC